MYKTFLQIQSQMVKCYLIGMCMNAAMFVNKPITNRFHHPIVPYFQLQLKWFEESVNNTEKIKLIALWKWSTERVCKYFRRCGSMYFVICAGNVIQISGNSPLLGVRCIAQVTESRTPPQIAQCTNLHISYNYGV